MREELKKEIEKLVDEKMEEKDTDASKEEIKREVLEELEERNEGGQLPVLGNLGSDKLSRRNFLKTIGIGAGGLALSSSVAGFSLWQPKNQGTSEIDADTLDGSNLSDLAGNQLNLNSGSLDVDEGSNSGLNADTVDGKDASDLETQLGWNKRQVASVGTYTNGVNTSKTTQTAFTGPPKTDQRNQTIWQRARFVAASAGPVSGTGYFYVNGNLKSKKYFTAPQSGTSTTTHTISGKLKYTPNDTLTAKVHANTSAGGASVNMSATQTWSVYY